MEPTVRSSSTSPNPQREYTRADLNDIPEGKIATIIDGRLCVSPRPRLENPAAIGEVAKALTGPYKKGIGGPGGWWIVPEPDLELPGAPSLVPALAGWRRERMPVPPENAPARVVPDWVCEIYSPAETARAHRFKSAYYARIGVPHMWTVDYGEILFVRRLVNGLWAEVGNYGVEDRVRAEPFDAVELVLAKWWPPAK